MCCIGNVCQTQPHFLPWVLRTGRLTIRRNGSDSVESDSCIVSMHSVACMLSCTPDFGLTNVVQKADASIVPYSVYNNTLKSPRSLKAMPHTGICFGGVSCSSLWRWLHPQLGLLWNTDMGGDCRTQVRNRIYEACCTEESCTRSKV